MENIVSEIKEYYEYLDSISDPRSNKWFLVPSIYSPVLAIAVYLLVVKLGPKLMDGREAFELRLPIAAYNFGAMMFNLYCCVELWIGSSQAGYSFGCEPVIVSTEPKEMRIANALWWFYFSKYYEMLDTVFFILRKKNNQITFLHVYHHASILALWWIGIKWVPGGSAFYSSMLNAFVHVVMYTYYGLSIFPSLRRFLWWKRYLTQLQLTQFCAFVGQAVYALHDDCGFPRWMGYGMILYMVSMLTLFGNFYFRTYRNARNKENAARENAARENAARENGVVANGVRESRDRKKLN